MQGGDSSAIIAAGLPNIVGSGQRTDEYYNTVPTSGALYVEMVYGKKRSSDTSNTDAPVIKFDASKSNPIYGSSDTVQPPALTLIPQIRY